MDFGALPPEVNSARRYAGAGAGSLLGSASAWQELAAELNSAAASYGSVVAGLTSGSWTGPSAVAMAAAASPYATWLTATGVQAQPAAAQLTVAVGAYETAYAATVPPPLTAANRSLQAAAVPPMVPFGNLGGRGGFGATATRYDFRPTVIPRSPAAG